MKTKTQINTLIKRVRAKREANKSDDYMRRYRDASKRGMILCPDGKERTLKEWLDYLPTRWPNDPGLADRLRSVIEEREKLS